MPAVHWRLLAAGSLFSSLLPALFSSITEGSLRSPYLLVIKQAPMEPPRFVSSFSSSQFRQILYFVPKLECKVKLVRILSCLFSLVPRGYVRPPSFPVISQVLPANFQKRLTPRCFRNASFWTLNLPLSHNFVSPGPPS